MAREINSIKKSITDSFLNNETIIDKYNIDDTKSFEEQFSKVSIENIIFDIVAFAIWILEKIFDSHKHEIDTMLLEQKPHTARWYRNKALEFQYGFDLLTDNDKFNNEGKTPEEIENSKIIKYSAVVESQDSRLIVKIATEENEELNPIGEQQQKSFEAYLQEIKDAGVRITVTNYLPDILQLSIRIFVNPLVLDVNGMSILTGKYPVEQALKEYVKELPFNGELVLQDLANKLERTEGVRIVQIDSALSKWIDPRVDGYGDFDAIDVKRIPESGYFKIESFDNIKYIEPDGL